MVKQKLMYLSPRSNVIERELYSFSDLEQMAIDNHSRLGHSYKTALRSLKSPECDETGEPLLYYTMTGKVVIVYGSRIHRFIEFEEKHSKDLVYINFKRDYGSDKKGKEMNNKQNNGKIEAEDIDAKQLLQLAEMKDRGTTDKAIEFKLVNIEVKDNRKLNLTYNVTYSSGKVLSVILEDVENLYDNITAMAISPTVDRHGNEICIAQMYTRVSDAISDYPIDYRVSCKDVVQSTIKEPQAVRVSIDTLKELIGRDIIVDED